MPSKKQRRHKTSKKRPRGKTQRKTRQYVIVSLLALALSVGAIWLLNQRQSVSAATPAEVAAEIIPQEGDPTSYGIHLSLANTQMFIDYYNTLALTPEQQNVMQEALLPLKAPCCDDNSMATCCCPCNLAKSVWGLSSYLIVEENYGSEQVKESALQWLRFIHSDYHIMRELENRGVNPGKYGLSYEAPCYSGGCELPFIDGGCGGMQELRE
jgi:hypothetical protein